MTSARKRYANRRNARASTGPRTARGKARAAQNARRHGLRLPALSDPAMTKHIGRLARQLAGVHADRERFEAACRIVAAQIDLVRIRRARLPLLARILVDRTAVKRLTALDLYESYARALRKRGNRDFGSARPPIPKDSEQPIRNDNDDNAIDVAAVLRTAPTRKQRRPRKPRTLTPLRRTSGFIATPAQPISAFFANEANARNINKNNV